MLDTTKAVSSVSFHVFRKDGSQNPDIKRYFLDNVKLTAYDASEGKLTLKDKTEWKLVLEPAVKAALLERDQVDCLVSFQARVDGNYAIARIFDPAKKAQKGVRK